MGFEWDECERSAFDEALTDHVLALFPEATIGWTDYGKRLLITFPDGVVASIWEPNFFHSFPSFTIEYLFHQVVTHIIASHAATLTRIDGTENEESRTQNSELRTLNL
jgi:hypothetical protein